MKAALDRIRDREGFTLGELTVTFEGGVGVVRGPSEGPFRRIPLGELRGYVRSDDRGRYRPLPGAKTLPGNWEVQCASPEEVVEAIESVYPLALVHQWEWTTGRLRVVGLDDVLERQSGRYRAAGRLSERGRQDASDVLCRRCVKSPVWRDETAPREGMIPCPEPCSVLVALCREAAIWEEEPPGRSLPREDIAFAAFEEAGNPIREAYLERRDAVASSQGE